MIISDKHRFAFIHIPKCAGSSVRHALMPFDDRRERYYDRGRDTHPDLGPLDFPHLPLEVVRDHFRDDFECLKVYDAYALVRDPIARFSSSLHEYLHWNHGLKLADLPPTKALRFTDEVIRRLGHYAGGTPIHDPALIHFSRQTDFVELDGERVVQRIFLMEEVDDLLDDIERRVGTLAGRKSRNRRIEYANPWIARASGAVQRISRKVLPRSITQPLFDVAKRGLLETGAASFLKGPGQATLLNQEAEAFVREFYASDIALRREVELKGGT